MRRARSISCTPCPGHLRRRSGTSRNREILRYLRRHFAARALCGLPISGRIGGTARTPPPSRHRRLSWCRKLYDPFPVYGIDGITFLDGTLFVNNVFSNKLYRIPVDASGKPGQPVDIWMDQPVKGPDGMRAVSGKLILAENGSGKISVISVNGDKASVTVIKEGQKTPTAVEPAGDVIWIAERGAGKAVSIPMPK